MPILDFVAGYSQWASSLKMMTRLQLSTSMKACYASDIAWGSVVGSTKVPMTSLGLVPFELETPLANICGESATPLHFRGPL